MLLKVLKRYKVTIQDSVTGKLYHYVIEALNVPEAENKAIIKYVLPYEGERHLHNIQFF